MPYHRRREKSKLESLLQWRRNVFLQAPGGGYVLVSATKTHVALHYFYGSLRGDPVRTERFPIPAGLFDGNGWNLAPLTELLRRRALTMNNQKPYVALYCNPLRESIRHLTDNELRVFITLTTYADEQSICFPGVRLLADDTGISTTDVSEALKSLAAKNFIHFLRSSQYDPLTRKLMADVYSLSQSIVALKIDSGIQAFLNQFHGEKLHNQNQYEESELESINQNQEPPPPTRTRSRAPAREAIAPSGAGKDSSNENSGKENAKEKTGDLPTPPAATDDPDDDKPPAAQRPQADANPAPAARPTATPSPKAPPLAAPPPPPPADSGDLKAFAVPLPQIDHEAYANELQYRCEGLQLAKARQLVSAYGLEQCAVGIGLLGKQPFGSVKNKPGWLISKLRQSALLPVDGHLPNPYTDGEFADFIEH